MPLRENPPSSVKNDGLSDGQSPDARDRAVDPRVVLVGTNHRLHHFGGRAPSVRIEVHHDAANVAHRDCDGVCIGRFAESEHAAQPLILLEGDRRTSALLPASQPISRTVSEAITEMPASSKIP